jgi:hypothetical protein
MCARAREAPPACRGGAVAATERTRDLARSIWRLLRQALGLLGTFGTLIGGVLGSLLASGAAKAVDLGPDQAELLYHQHNGDGLKAYGPAVLLRKSVMGKVAITGTAYVDAVSNASIDVVTSASPFSERRTEYGLSADYVYREALLTLSASSSKEPDYVAKRVGLDLAQDVFGGMSTISMGFTRGADDVAKHGEPSFAAKARHWQYRVGSSLILTPRWIVSANAEALADEGYLGSPYRVAYEFGAAVAERVPATRSSRAVKLRLVGDLGSRDAIQLGARYSWDTWGIQSTTLDIAYSRYFGEDWLADVTLRQHRQDKAVFYSDNAQQGNLFVTRNRQLGTMKDIGVGGKVAYTLSKVPGQYDITLNGAYEFVQYKFKDFTDLRTGKAYQYNAGVLQVFVSTHF